MRYFGAQDSLYGKNISRGVAMADLRYQQKQMVKAQVLENSGKVWMPLECMFPIQAKKPSKLIKFDGTSVKDFVEKYKVVRLYCPQTVDESHPFLGRSKRELMDLIQTLICDDCLAGVALGNTVMKSGMCIYI